MRDYKQPIKDEPESTTMRWFTGLFAAVAFVLVLCFAYGFVNWLEMMSIKL